MSETPSELVGRARDLVGVRSAVVGRSAEGRPLHRLEVGPEGAPELSVVLAGIHAMEWIGVRAACAIAEALDDRALDRRVRIYPLVNPDGAERVIADRVAGRRRFRRTNARGVDLNRNWPTHWKSARGGTRLLPFLGHSGSSPGSEPEIQAVLADLPRRVDRALSLHSFGRMILHPYGGVWRAPEDAAAHRAAAEALAAGIDGARYRIRQSARWVPGAFAPGMELDHLHDAFGALALLVELSPGGLDLVRPASWVNPPRWFDPPGAVDEVARVVPGLVRFLVP